MVARAEERPWKRWRSDGGEPGGARSDTRGAASEKREKGERGMRRSWGSGALGSGGGSLQNLQAYAKMRQLSNFLFFTLE